MIRYNINYCDNCSLGIFNGFIPVSGKGLGTDIMIIGEAPGVTESKKGEPFVGKSGNLLRKYLDRLGLTEYCYITNGVKCRPPQNRPPRINEINKCRAYLIKEIQLYQPKLIILLGLSAIKSFYPESNYIFPYLYKFTNIGKTIITCSYHPSYIIRNKDKEEAYTNFFNNISILYSSLNPCYFNPYLNEQHNY